MSSASDRLRKIKRFDQLLAYLRDELDWPVDEFEFDELTYDWEPEELGIETRTYRHQPVYTVEENKALRGDLPGGHCKNLFLRDKKRNMWLVIAEEDRTIDLKSLRRRLDTSGNLSFGNAELHNVASVLGGVGGLTQLF